MQSIFFVFRRNSRNSNFVLGSDSSDTEDISDEVEDARARGLVRAEIARGLRVGALWQLALEIEAEGRGAAKACAHKAHTAVRSGALQRDPPRLLGHVVRREGVVLWREDPSAVAASSELFTVCFAEAVPTERLGRD